MGTEEKHNASEIRDLAAKTAYEINRVFCMGLGDLVPYPWDVLPEEQRDGYRKGVWSVLDGATPEILHLRWMDEKVKKGWVYGPVKDDQTKTHPCLLPYNDPRFPKAQKTKDVLFQAVVQAVLEQYGILCKPF